ncbi:hypothetical protein FSP39_021559 [Pinctada imbricata]|uniref:Neurotransmitter-gated ion-channel ligand-binding domain-containing protein n=1 Tax=Pinctada imbricata TaxID=66713 RepID=A0AA88Y0V9_PINIB|nr:hypothetical protein FSP39_021559 [Pinctada imbricata]
MTWLLYVIFSQFVILSSGSSFGDMKALMEYLESNNTKNIRPRFNQSNPLDIYVQVRLYTLADFDVSKGKLTLALSFYFSWLDELKSWNSTNFGGISRASVPADYVFIPDMALYTSLSESNKLIGNDVTKENVKINQSGNVHVVVNGLYEVLCEPDVKMFPFDRHTCRLKIPANRPRTEIRLNSKYSILDDVMQSNTRWVYESSTHEIIETVGSYDILHYDITFRRSSFFLALNLVVPICILSVVNSLVFLMPVDSDEKVSFSITLLLSFVVFVSAVSDKLPEASEPCIFNVVIIVQLVYSSVITLSVIALSRYEGDADSHIKTLDCNCHGHKNKVDYIKDESEVQMKSSKTINKKKCCIGSCAIVCFICFMLFVVIEIIVMAAMLV